MKVKKFFDKLNGELDSVVPKLDGELKNMPITVSENAEEYVQSQENGYEIKQKSKFKFNFSDLFTIKKLALIATACLLVLVTVFTSISLTFNSGVIVRVDINPSFELVLNEQMRVEKVVSLNADGDVVLKQDGVCDLILGQDLKTAVKIIAENATQLGFIDYKKDGTDGEYNKLSFVVEGNKRKLPKDLIKDTEEYLVEYFKSSGIYLFVQGVASKTGDFKAKMQEVSEKSTYYLEEVKQNDIFLKSYVTQLIFDYCNTLLNYSLEKYDLLFEINELNTQIKQAQDSFLADWNYEGDDQEILSLVTQLNAKRQEYSQKFKEEITNEINLILKLNDYILINIEGLKELAEKGIDDSFFSLENYQLLFDFTSIAVESFIKDVIDFYEVVSSSISGGYDKTIELLTQELENVRKRFSESPELETITEEDYLNFVNTVVSNLRV